MFKHLGRVLTTLAITVLGVTSAFAVDIEFLTPADMGLSAANLGTLVLGVIGLALTVWGGFYAYGAITAKLQRAKKA